MDIEYSQRSIQLLFQSVKVNRHDYGSNARTANISNIYVSRYSTQPGDFDARSRYHQAQTQSCFERMRDRWTQEYLKTAIRERERTNRSLLSCFSQLVTNLL